MMLVVDESGVTVRNAATLTADAYNTPTLLISGNRVTFVNETDGRISAVGSFEPAIVVTGQGVRIENQLGGVIGAGSSVIGTAIRGSDYDDIVIDAGRVTGYVYLGAGNDEYVSRSDVNPWIDLGEGDDVLRCEVAEDFGLVASGGAGYDRHYVTGNVSSLRDSTSGFEFLSVSRLEDSRFLTYFSFYQAMAFESGGLYNLYASVNPDVALDIADINLTIGAGSVFGSATGGAGDDILWIEEDGKILGDVALGDGDDLLLLGYDVDQVVGPTILGTADGGSGGDTLSLFVRSDQTVDLHHFTGFEFLNVGFSPDPRQPTVTLTELSSFAEVSSGSGKLVIADDASGTAVRFGGRTLTIAAGAAVAAIEVLWTGSDRQVVNLGTVLGDVHLNGPVDYDGRLGRVDGTIFGSSGADTIRGGANDDRIVGDYGADDLRGGAGDDDISGGWDEANIFGDAGDDTLRAGLRGNNLLHGGEGDDSYVVDAQTSLVEQAGEGIDTVRSTVSWTLGDNLENLVLVDDGAPGHFIGGTGNAQDNAITGNDQDNRLDGMAGADLLRGGKGDDTYVVDSIADRVVELAGEGRDTILSSITLTLVDNVERLELTGAAAIDATGNEAANYLHGNDAANALDGKAGADTMNGEGGDDRYFVDASEDTIIEGPGEGYDIVVASADFVLPWDVEELVLTGAALAGSGNSLANVVTGNAEANQLDGMAGADTLAGGAGDDHYVIDDAGDVVIETGSAGHDTIAASVSVAALAADVEDLVLTAGAVATGNVLDNHLTGNAGINALDGAAGADTMAGGQGNDRYAVDDAGDVVVEAVGGGFDTVYASVDFALSDEVERLFLSGAAVRATGNALANDIGGTAGDNRLDGRAGADTMVGGKGDDVYTVDDAGDRVVEASGGGKDSINAAIGFSLSGLSVETLTLTGSAAIDATGNRFANRLNGNGAANTLDGAGGADTMAGGRGDDVYFVDDAGDKVIEASRQGSDTVHASVSFSLAGQSIETLVLTGKAVRGYGNDGANRITGNAVGNTLTGGSGDDWLDGGAGKDRIDGGRGRDTLTGGAGQDALTGGSNADHFVFAKGDTGSTRATADRIVDFSHSQHDRIDLSQIDASTKAKGNQAFHFIGSDAFAGHAGELRSFKVNGLLFVAGDTDGDMTADLVIRVDGAKDLVAADFML